MSNEYFTQEFANAYDERNKNLSPIMNALHLTLELALKDIKCDAKILCVGAGTGAEVVYLAQRFPNWQFTCIEPSQGMMDIMQQKLNTLGLIERCQLHLGYIDSYQSNEKYDAALSILVSHFILKMPDRLAYYKAIYALLRPNSPLINADISANRLTDNWPNQLAIWLNLHKKAGASSKDIETLFLSQINKAIAVESNEAIENLLHECGFKMPTKIYQALLINAWISSA